MAITARSIFRTIYVLGFVLFIFAWWSLATTLATIQLGKELETYCLRNFDRFGSHIPGLAATPVTCRLSRLDYRRGVYAVVLGDGYEMRMEARSGWLNWKRSDHFTLLEGNLELKRVTISEFAEWPYLK